jgi:hypothetical protein
MCLGEASAAGLMWITIKQRTIVIGFHQVFVASSHSDFFQRHTDRDLIFWPNHSQESQLFK